MLISPWKDPGFILLLCNINIIEEDLKSQLPHMQKMKWIGL